MVASIAFTDSNADGMLCVACSVCDWRESLVESEQGCSPESECTDGAGSGRYGLAFPLLSMPG